MCIRDRCTQVTNPKGAVQTRRYDALGRVTEVEDFDGNHIHLRYDLSLIHIYQILIQLYDYKGIAFNLSRDTKQAVKCFLKDVYKRQSLNGISHKKVINSSFACFPSFLLMVVLSFFRN